MLHVKYISVKLKKNFLKKKLKAVLFFFFFFHAIAISIYS